jgi:putative hemolysin
MFVYEIVVIVLMLACNAVFASYEMALASISRSRIALLIEEKKRGAREAGFMKDRMEWSLTTIQIGITLCGALAAATGGAGVDKALVPYLTSRLGMTPFFSEMTALIILIVPLTLATIIFGELVPKMFALNNKETVTLVLSPVMRSLSALMHPVVSVIEGVVKGVMKAVVRGYQERAGDEKRVRLHELKTAVSLARASRVLGGREERMILSAAQFRTRAVGEIALPSADIFTIPLESSLTDAFLKAHLDMHTRFPVCAVENDPQSIQGYVNFKDIVVALKMGSGSAGIMGIVRPIMRLNEQMTISESLETMMREKAHIALVLSGGRVSGMVTLEDIIEELLGDVEDEFDRPALWTMPYGQGWLMGGGVPITLAAAKLGLDWSAAYRGAKPPSLQGWCEEKLGRSLTGGETIESGGIMVVPRKFRRKQLLEAMVMPVQKTRA